MSSADRTRSRRPRQSTPSEAENGGRRTGLLVAAGIAVALVGLALAAAPGATVGAGPLRRWHLSAVGVLAMLGALQAARQRLRSGDRSAETGEPESPRAVQTPGAAVDDALAAIAGPGSGSIADRREIRNRLDGAVVAQLSRVEGHSDERARALVADGEWTDDPAAAAFLGDAHVAPEQSVQARLRRAVSRESLFQRRGRRGIAALGARAGIDVASLARPITTAARSDDAGPREPSGAPADTDAHRGSETGAATTGAPRSTQRWLGISALGLLAVGVGVLLRSPAAMMAGVVGLGFAGYARSGTAPLATLAVERTLSTPSPDPGDPVTVRVTVRNEGERLLPDLRIVDGVPPALSVTDGSPRLGVGLRPGKAATFQYTVTARPGTHRFGPVDLVARDLTGSIEDRFAVEPVDGEDRAPGTAGESSTDGATAIVCRPVLRASESVPLGPLAIGTAGRVETTTGGAGTEFHSTREYRRGDPMSRINWHRLASTGELTTVEFREERDATVVLVLDARTAAYRSPGDATGHAVEREVVAAARIATALLDDGARVGLSATGPAPCWLPPGTGDVHRAKLRRLLADGDCAPPTPPADSISQIRWLRRLHRRLPSDAQLVFLSPLADDVAAFLARKLVGVGHPVTVVSPDPTDDRTAGQVLARVERLERVAALRERGIDVVEWTWEEPVDAALERAAVRHRR